MSIGDRIYGTLFLLMGVCGLAFGAAQYVTGNDQAATSATALALAALAVADHYKLARRVKVLEDAARRDAMERHPAKGSGV